MDGFYLCKGNPRLDINYAKELDQWTYLGLSAASLAYGAAPNGETCYDYYATATSGTHSVRRSIESEDDCAFFEHITFVSYVKAMGNQQTVCFVIKLQDDTYYARVFADLVNGVIISNPTYDEYTHSDILSIGDGWYKVMVTAKGEYNLIAKESVLTSIMYLVDPSTDYELSYTANQSDGVRIWKSFTFFGNDVEDYLPDLTEALAADYNRAHSQSVALHIGWGVTFPTTQMRFDSTDLSGKRTMFVTGSYKKWSLPIPFMYSYHAHMINHWWRDREPVYFYNGLIYTTTQVMIVNKNEPFSWARDPYFDILEGTIELEATL